MTVDKSFITYQHLVYLQEQQPTKKRVVELRKALIELKKECDIERKRLLNKSPELAPSIAIFPTPEVEAPPTYEAKQSIAEADKSPDPKLPEVDVSWQSPLPLTRELSLSVSSSEPVKAVEVKKEKKTRKIKKSKQM